MSKVDKAYYTPFLNGIRSFASLTSFSVISTANLTSTTPSLFLTIRFRKKLFYAQSMANETKLVIT